MCSKFHSKKHDSQIPFSTKKYLLTRWKTDSKNPSNLVMENRWCGGLSSRHAGGATSSDRTAGPEKTAAGVFFFFGGVLGSLEPGWRWDGDSGCFGVGNVVFLWFLLLGRDRKFEKKQKNNDVRLWLRGSVFAWRKGEWCAKDNEHDWFYTVCHFLVKG